MHRTKRILREGNTNEGRRNPVKMLVIVGIFADSTISVYSLEDSPKTENSCKH